MAGFSQLNSALAGVVKSLQSVQTQAQATASSLGEARTKIKQEADSIDDLFSRLSKGRSAFDDEVRLQLDLLKVAGGDIQKFLSDFGDAVIVTEKGVRKISDLVQEADLQGIERDVRKLALELDRGTKTVGDVLTFLQDQGGKFAQTLTSWVQALQAGKISLDRFAELIRGLQTEFGDTEFANLADSLLTQLQDGALRNRL